MQRSGRALEVGNRYFGTIRFEDRDWPLPEGEWELLAHIPFRDEISGGWAIRVALARYDPGQHLRAVIIFVLSDGKENDIVTASVPACQAGTAAFAAEREIVDNVTNFACWRITATTPDQFPQRDPVYAAVRAKLATMEDAPAEFVIVDGIKKSERRGLHVVILLNPVSLQMAPGSPDLLMSFHPERLQADGWEGTRLDVLMMLRNFAIRWTDGLWAVFAGQTAAEGRGAGLPLPVLRNLHGSTTTAPNTGMRVGTIFTERLNIGPFVVPLPPGNWTVVLRTPRSLPNGAFVADNVMLANLDDGFYHGVVQIEYRPLNPVAPESERLCTGNVRPVLARERPDTFCATARLTNLDPAMSRDAFLDELALRGMETPKMTAGAEVVFSNRVMVMRVMVQFSPRHIGLPEPGEREPRGMPVAWAPFRLKYADFVYGWAHAIEAGLTGGLGAGPLPPKWRDLDLVSESFIASEAPKVGETYAGTVPLGGRNWPLPAGQWMVLASVPRMERNEVVEDQIYLANLSSSGVEGVVSLGLSRPDMPLGATRILHEPPTICNQSGRAFGERVRVEAGLRFDCWDTDIVPLSMARQNHGYEGFEAALRARGAQLPEFQLAVRYAIASQNRVLVARYAFPWRFQPTPPTASADAASPTTTPDAAKRADGLLARVAARRWAAAWHGAVKDGFDRKLGPGPLPDRWKDSHPGADFKLP